MISIAQVAFFDDPRKSDEFGLAVWSAFKEVESFFNFRLERASYVRTYLSARIPADLPRGQKGETIGQLPEKGSSPDTPRRLRARTYGYREVVGMLNRHLPIPQENLVVVTDLELTPPQDWRYVIWDGGSEGTVISTAPCDPSYWGIRDESRIATVKHRIRAATLSVTGRLLGLVRCDNPECFSYANVDSVTRLDSMVKLGPEHQELSALANRGFLARAGDPKVEQAAQRDPPPFEAA